MTVKIYDLSVTMEPNPAQPVDVTHSAHKDGAPAMMSIFGCKESDLPGGLGWAVDNVTLGTHAGTHVDAPWHYAPTSEGKKAKTIDEIPMEWFYGDGVVIDMRHKPRGAAVTVDDFKAALEKIGYTLKAGDIVLVQTGADRFWGKPEYTSEGCGMTRESTLWLIEQGIRVMGTDAWGWDRPFWAIREEFEKTGDKNVIWEAHFAGIEKEINIVGGSAGWVRVAAIFDE